MLFESTTDGLAVNHAGLLGREGADHGPAFLESDFGALTVDRGREEVPFLLGDRSTGVPECVRGGPVGAVGSGAGVGFGAGGGGVLPGPVGGAAAGGGVLFGASFQRTNAGFNRPIVPWRAGW